MKVPDGVHLKETLFATNIQNRGVQTFALEGHISYCATFQGPDILHNVIVLGYVTFYQIKNFCKYIIVSLLTKCLRGPDEMAAWAGFGPRVTVWRSLV